MGWGCEGREAVEGAGRVVEEAEERGEVAEAVGTAGVGATGVGATGVGAQTMAGAADEGCWKEGGCGAV